MLAGRRPGSYVSLGAGAGVEWWLSSGVAGDGERRLRAADALAAARRAVLGRSVEMSRIQALVVREGLAGPFARGLREQWSVLEAALRHGQLIVVERPRRLDRLGHDGPLADADPVALDDDAELEILELQREVLIVRVIEAASAHAVSGLALELDGGGELRSGSSDGGGGLRFEEVPRGFHGLRLDSVDGVEWGPDDEELDRAQRGDRERSRADDRCVEVALDLSGQTSSKIQVETGALNWLILERAILRPLVPDFLRFDHGSALLVPAPWTEGRHPLAGVVHALLSMLDAPARWLLVVGHASAPGKDAANQALSEQRADVIRALVEDDAGAWVEHARERGSLRDVIAYLDYLGRERGWPCACETPVESLGTSATAETRALVRAFQEEYDARFEGALAVDGVCGAKTLGALFEVLRDEFERWLAKLGTTPAQLPLQRVVYAGHGATLAGREGAGDEAEGADRVVDLILVEGRGVVFPEQLEPDALAEFYDSAVPRRLPFEVPDEPDEWATGPFTIVSDLTPDEPAAPETYELRSEDDSWAREHILPDEGVLESGELVLHFEALPTELRYTLSVTASDGTRSVIFEDLGYGQLHGAPRERS